MTDQTVDYEKTLHTCANRRGLSATKIASLAKKLSTAKTPAAKQAVIIEANRGAIPEGSYQTK